jgi:hypothetical protein
MGFKNEVEIQMKKISTDTKKTNSHYVLEMQNLITPQEKID